MKAILLPVLALALAPLAAVSAQTTSGQETSSSDKAAAASEEKLICRSDKMTGSRLKVRKVCMTKAQWDELAVNTRKGLNDYSRGTATGLTEKSPFGS
ncbi:hypothetical protein [Tsuneonella sp. HG222]